MAIALWGARFFVPEAVDQGATLGIVVVWSLFIAMSGYILWRKEGALRLEVGWFDVAVWGFVGSHVIAALALLIQGGNKRTALNFLFEWIGSGIAVTVLSRLHSETSGPWHRLPACDLSDNMVQKRGSRRKWVTTAVALLALLMSAHGFYQRFVSFPELRALVTRWEELKTSPSLSAAQERELRTAERQLSPEFVGGSDAIRQQYKQRLFDSSEPLAWFAHPNTLGGFLAVGLLALLGATALPGNGRIRILCQVLAIAAIAFCLLLTKSRTACVGFACGLTLWAILDRLDRRCGWRTIVVMGVIGGGLVGTAIRIRGVDREVFTEAAKSLTYRLEYWKGAVGIIQEHPLGGVGPGQFRPHYLKYKAAGASEEIADPHQLLLDVWASAGIPAALCLLWLSAGALRGLWYSAGNREIPRADVVDSYLWLAPTFVAGWLYTIEAETEWSVILAAIAACVWWISSTRLQPTGPTAVSTAAISAGAWMALTLHLCGAGGIASPVTTQLWLLLTGELWETARLARGKSEWTRQCSPMWLVGSGLTLCLTTVYWGFVPVTLCRWSLVDGRSLQVEGRSADAGIQFHAAEKSDPLDPDPPRELAIWYWTNWQRDVADGDFRRGVDAANRALAKHPHDPGIHRLLGQAYLQKFARAADPATAAAAVASLQRAAAGYPHSAGVQADWAEALSAAGDLALAHSTATRALELNALNATRGHKDKLLPAGTVERLRALAR